MKTLDRSSLSVLIVENDAGYRATLRIVLRNIGILNVYESKNAVQAFQILRKHRIDIILSEHQLPGISGHQLICAIRSKRNLPFWAVPIIFISQSCEKKHVIAAIDSGVDAFLVKPVQPSSLAQRLDVILSGERQAFEIWLEKQEIHLPSQDVGAALTPSEQHGDTEDVFMI